MPTLTRLLSPQVRTVKIGEITGKDKTGKYQVYVDGRNVYLMSLTPKELRIGDLVTVIDTPNGMKIIGTSQKTTFSLVTVSING